MKDKIVRWIRNYFNKNGGPDTKAVIGISGGKDSTVAAALCVEALGADRVFGVLIPQDLQKDIYDSNWVVTLLGIPHCVINIGQTCTALYSAMNRGLELEGNAGVQNSSIVATNTPARIRMATLYAVAGMIGGRVCNTSNAAEIYVGYSTKWGDGVGDFGPLRGLTVAEVIEVGRECGLPEELLVKPPADGMSGLTDEDNLGFTYEEVAKVMNNDIVGMDLNTYAEIERRHAISLHKQVNIPMPILNSIPFD